MKILCLSDLHQRMTDISDVIHQRRFTPFLQSIRNLVDDMQPDVAVVTGDTVPTPYVSSLNAFFGNLFPSELPVVATLGNHEFFGRTFEETLECILSKDPNFYILIELKEDDDECTRQVYDICQKHNLWSVNPVDHIPSVLHGDKDIS